MSNNTSGGKPKKIWFKAKRYGWGWTPVAWQGWLILLAYLALAVGAFLLADSEQYSISGTLISFALPFILLTCCLLTICYKMGEKPHWSWGDKHDIKK